MKLHQDVSATGTYVALKPSASTKALLGQWASQVGLTLEPDLHVTVLYSRKPIAVSVSSDEHHAIPLSFGPLGDAALVVHLMAPTIDARHRQLISQGGTHDHADFMAHMTLVAKTDRLLPKALPMFNFGLIFGEEYVEALST